MSDALRIYDPVLDDILPTGYPRAWSLGEPAVKDLVRELAGHRCVRCGHPYRKGEHGKGEWTPCDELCTHRGPFQGKRDDPDWTFYPHSGEGAVVAGVVVRQGFAIEAQWRILTVHHLNGRKTDLRWWNLAALCQRCHLTIQGRVQMERVWPWEHSEWFKPYVAGYYASVYLGEELSREQVEARLDELLGLERVA